MKLERIEGTGIPYIKGIFYGKAGSGKTWLTASTVMIPSMSPVLMLSCVGNTVSLRRWQHAPFIIRINEIADIEEIYNWLIGGMDPKHPIVTVYKEKFGIDLPCDFKTVIIDQLTGIQGMFMRNHLKTDTAWNKFKKAEFDGWGALLQYMESISYNFFEVLEMNVLMTAQERVEVDQLSNIQSWGIGLSGQSQHIVPSYSPLIGRMVRQAQINSATAKQLKLREDAYTTVFFDVFGHYEAKDQLGLDKKFIQDPTMTKILDALTRTEQGKQSQTSLTDSKGQTSNGQD